MTEAPTFFGTVSYTLDSRDDGATVSLANRWTPGAGPTAVVIHTPWFVTLISATVDGQPVPAADGTVTVPPMAKTVILAWRRGPEPNLSYEEAVRLYLEKYYRKPAGADYDFLFPRPGRPGGDAAPSER